MICYITMFKEETGGISEHPAELLDVPSGKSDRGLEPLRTMIEKTGVTDPELHAIEPDTRTAVHFRCSQKPSSRWFTTCNHAKTR